MSKTVRCISAAIFILIGISILIAAVTLWPKPFNLFIVLAGIIPISAAGLGFIFVGCMVFNGMSIREAFEYLNFF